ncbi:hypothetical protein IWX49DRAFT_291226 [Phyllosticta citricarpa]|uniref:Secreted protein n=2 Tax=Phyllosticta TaxID=121621 RepID=A0ABR1MJS0_9PEZI
MLPPPTANGGFLLFAFANHSLSFLFFSFLSLDAYCLVILANAFTSLAARSVISRVRVNLRRWIQRRCRKK